MASSKKKPKKKTRKPARVTKRVRVSASSSPKKPTKKKPAKPAKKPARKRSPKGVQHGASGSVKSHGLRSSKSRKSAPKKKPATKTRPKLTKRQKAARKGARTRKRNRLERESIQLGELARVEVDREAAARRAAGDERQLLIDILEDMRNAGASVLPISLSITESEVGARVPWTVVGRFDCVDMPTYAELDELFSAWRDDLLLEAAIHPQRLSQIRIVYSDPNAKRGESDSVISHMGPWEAVISETAFELDPDSDDSLANRYKDTKVPTFYVYFSGRLSSEVEFPL